MKKLAPFGTGLLVFSASACSEPPECADYRVAEVDALVEWKNAQVVHERASATLEEIQSANAAEMKDRIQRRDEALGRHDRGEFDDDEIEISREALAFIHAVGVSEMEKKHEETELPVADLAFRAAAELESAHNRHTVAVAVRVSQGCSPPKDVLEEDVGE